jgi:large subunit ribosomal protein L25
MSQIQELAAQARSGSGKGPAYQTRQKGLIPAVIYGGGSAPESVAVDRHELERFAFKGTFLTTLFMLDVAGRKTRVIPRDIQLDPVSDRPVHVDFMRLPEGARVRLAIPVHFRGQETSPGIKRGGVLNIVRREVELYCPAENIPAYIEADLSTLDIHDTLHISAFALPDGVRPVIHDRDFTVASIVAPTSVIEEQKAAAAAATGAAAAPTAEAAAAEAAAATPAAGAAPAAGKAPAAEAPKKK